MTFDRGRHVINLFCLNWYNSMFHTLQHHRQKPFVLDNGPARVGYEPGESESKLFGGNSNWRGPIWFPSKSPFHIQRLYELLPSLSIYHHCRLQLSLSSSSSVSNVCTNFSKLYSSETTWPFRTKLLSYIFKTVRFRKNLTWVKVFRMIRSICGQIFM